MPDTFKKLAPCVLMYPTFNPDHPMGARHTSTRAFIPKHRLFYIFMDDTSGPWFLCLVFNEDGAAMIVASTYVPERRVEPLSHK